MQHICTVKDCFDIKGKGIALTCAAHDDSLIIPVGSEIEIRQPGAVTIHTRALGFELLRNSWSPHLPRNMGVLVPQAIGLHNVARESEIWACIAQPALQSDAAAPRGLS